MLAISAIRLYTQVKRSIHQGPKVALTIAIQLFTVSSYLTERQRSTNPGAILYVLDHYSLMRP